LRIHKSAVSGAVEGKVYTVEPTGDITFVQVYLGSAIVIVSLDPNVPIRPDEPVWVAFDQDRIHLFDGETQKALAVA
jgi:multiple sugar transport system ATP-binding protein